MWIYDFIPSDWAAIRSNVLYIHWLYATDQLQPVVYAYFHVSMSILKDGLVLSFPQFIFKK